MFLFVHSYCKARCADFCWRAVQISIIIIIIIIKTLVKIICWVRPTRQARHPQLPWRLRVSGCHFHNSKHMIKLKRNNKNNLLFQVKTENPPLVFCLLIYHFLSSVSIKPMTTMLVFCGACVCVSVGVCGVLCMCGRKCLWHAYLLCKRPGLSWERAP